MWGALNRKTLSKHVGGCEVYDFYVHDKCCSLISYPSPQNTSERSDCPGMYPEKIQILFYFVRCCFSLIVGVFICIKAFMTGSSGTDSFSFGGLNQVTRKTSASPEIQQCQGQFLRSFIRHILVFNN